MHAELNESRKAFNSSLIRLSLIIILDDKAIPNMISVSVLVLHHDARISCISSIAKLKPYRL